MNPSTPNSLASETTLGYAHLTVSDLSRSLDFYQFGLGLQVHRRQGDTAYLGAGAHDLVALTETPGATKAPRTTGLYHFALLVPSRLALAHALRRLIDYGADLTGGSDHGVSEAIYLDDPDGNGIEVYRDRPRLEWPFVDGALAMTTDPLDVQGILGLLADAAVEPRMAPDTVLGHMHLHVAHLEEAVEFYRSVIGFELQMYYGRSAAFLSAGGYHHHVGVNTWNGAGAPPPPPESAGLRYFTVRLDGQAELNRLKQRLEGAPVSVEVRGDGLFVRDPSQNGLLFTVA